MDKIIDISQFNTITDWDAIKKNADAVIIRMGFTYSRNGYLCVDNNYVVNRQTCKLRNIPYSMYFFTNAINEEEAIREADFVAYECRDIAKYVLPVFCDTERIDGLGRADNLDKDTRTKCVKAFCDRLQSQGVPAGVYCNSGWLNNQLDKSRLPYSLWIAQWGNDEPIDNYLIWQYTNQGTIPGISGRVDISRTKPTTKSSLEKVITLAINEIGYIEKRNNDAAYLYTKDKNAGSANYTKYGYELHMMQPYNMDYPAPWCMCFISWLFVQLFGLAKAKSILYGDIDDYTIDAARRFKNNNKWFTSPQVGDIIFFKDDTGKICHVGIVYNINSNAVYTIEGNTSSAAGVIANGGCVRAKSYPLNYKKIAGYGRPNYPT